MGASATENVGIVCLIYDKEIGFFKCFRTDYTIVFCIRLYTLHTYDIVKCCCIKDCQSRWKYNLNLVIEIVEKLCCIFIFTKVSILFR